MEALIEVKFTYPEQALVTGSWDSWHQKEQLRQDNNQDDSPWSLAKTLPHGKYEYKFIVHDTYINDPSNSLKSLDPPYNNILVVPCERITISYQSGSEQYSEVKLCGDPWTEYLPMKRKNEQWEINLIVPVGVFEYKFLCDGQWKTDMTAPHRDDENQNNYVMVNQNLGKIKQVNEAQVEVPMIVQSNNNEQPINNYQVNSPPPISSPEPPAQPSVNEQISENVITNTTVSLEQKLPEKKQTEKKQQFKKSPAAEKPVSRRTDSPPIGISVCMSPLGNITSEIYEQLIKYLQDEVKEVEILKNNSGVAVIVALADSPRVSQFLPPGPEGIPIILQKNNNFNSVVENLQTNLKNLVVVQFSGEKDNLEFKFMPGQREKLIALSQRL